MSLDFNDAGPQRSGFDLIPNGAICRLIGTIRPGGKSRPGAEALDANWLTASRTKEDSLYLNFEFVVTEGPYANRRIWQNMSVAGGEVDTNGQSKGWNITRATVRAMLNSANNLAPDDESERALSMRRVNTWGDLNGIEFLAKIKINKAKPDSPYQDQNAIGVVIEPGDKGYAAGGSGFVASTAPKAATPAPAWATNAPKAAPAPPVAAAPAPATGASARPAWMR
jgi:hypothetical protein